MNKTYTDYRKVLDEIERQMPRGTKATKRDMSDMRVRELTQLCYALERVQDRLWRISEVVEEHRLWKLRSL